MRCDQPLGLPPTAEDFLRVYEYIDCCPTCKRPIPQLEIIGKYSGFNSHPLYRHPLRDGRWADEVLQANPWSSGPVFFLSLQVSDGQQFCWSEDEIAERI